MTQKNESPPIPWGLILLIIAGVAAIFAIIMVLFVILSYNGIVSSQQSVVSQWAQVASQYQRRADLIPNLVNTVKGYMVYESALLSNITALRSQWQSAATREEKLEAANGLESSLGRLLIVMENYPDLKADAEVTRLMDELAGTENRIAVERMRYNDNVRVYNTKIKSFPGFIFAGLFGFVEEEYFESYEGSEYAPVVDLT